MIAMQWELFPLDEYSKKLIEYLNVDIRAHIEFLFTG